MQLQWQELCLQHIHFRKVELATETCLLSKKWHFFHRNISSELTTAHHPTPSDLVHNRVQTIHAGRRAGGFRYCARACKTRQAGWQQGFFAVLPAVGPHPRFSLQPLPSARFLTQVMRSSTTPASEPCRGIAPSPMVAWKRLLRPAGATGKILGDSLGSNYSRGGYTHK